MIGDGESEIVLNVLVTGQDQVDALNYQLKNLQTTQGNMIPVLDDTKKKSDAASESWLKQAQSLRAVERGVAAYILILYAMQRAYKELEKSSLSLQAVTEDNNKAFLNSLTPIGDYIARIVAGSQALLGMANAGKVLGDSLKFAFNQTGFGAMLNVIANQAPAETNDRVPHSFLATQAGYQSEIQKLQGNDMMSLLSKQYEERQKLLEKYTGKELQIYQDLSNKKQALERENMRLSELGLQRQNVIDQNMVKGLTGSFISGTSSSINGLLTGQRQSPADLLKNFTNPLAKVISDTLAEKLATFLFGPKMSPAEQAASRQRDQIKSELKEINDKCNCMCSAAQSSKQTALGVSALSGLNFGGISGLTANITGSLGSEGGGGFSSLLSSVLPLLGTVAGGPGVGAAISMGEGAFAKHHSGGFVGAFATGGEVPALVQPGEFIVNRVDSQANKDVLQSINSGKKVQGTTNVFMIRANDANSFAAMLSTPSGRNEISTQVIRSIMNNSDLRKILKDFAK